MLLLVHALCMHQLLFICVNSYVCVCVCICMRVHVRASVYMCMHELMHICNIASLVYLPVKVEYVGRFPAEIVLSLKGFIHDQFNP